ncbi:oxalurate catabolism protein HpxZ [Zavarzinia sp. CC-PAN008]|uniref:oxalurate catabolism protein HpxZ n=1 Tax=Zavarzinia sp. CC-PAN008 TaxID=3243332 RepID=UPI003F743E67
MTPSESAIDDPAVKAEVEAAFARYEAALVGNDTATLNALFWTDDRVLRFGPAENLYGHAAIAAYRAGRDQSDLARSLENTRITTFGRDFAVANTEYVRTKSGRRGRQSQTWARLDGRWVIVAAHVSLLD